MMKWMATTTMVITHDREVQVCMAIITVIIIITTITPRFRLRHL